MYEELIEQLRTDIKVLPLFMRRDDNKELRNVHSFLALELTYGELNEIILKLFIDDYVSTDKIIAEFVCHVYNDLSVIEIVGYEELINHYFDLLNYFKDKAELYELYEICSNIQKFLDNYDYYFQVAKDNLII